MKMSLQTEVSSFADDGRRQATTLAGGSPELGGPVSSAAKTPRVKLPSISELTGTAIHFPLTHSQGLPGAPAPAGRFGSSSSVTSPSAASISSGISSAGSGSISGSISAASSISSGTPTMASSRFAEENKIKGASAAGAAGGGGDYVWAQVPTHYDYSTQSYYQSPYQTQRVGYFLPPIRSVHPSPYMVPEIINKPSHKCHRCGTTETPEWRRGPNGVRTLCNACGLFHAKLVKRKGAALAAKEILNNKVCKGKNGRRISIKQHFLDNSQVKLPTYNHPASFETNYS